MKNQRFVYLVTRQLAGDATPEERDALDELLASDRQLREVYILLFKKPEKVADEEICSHAMQAYTAHFAKIQLAQMQANENGRARNRGRRTKRLLGWCGSAAVVAICWIFVRTGSNEDASHGEASITPTEVTTDKGMKKHFFLPDSTEVWLNADSRLVYKNDPSVAARVINFTGEAYFDVAEKAGRPFIIYANGIQIRVLGTSFNVRAYPDEENTETALLEGMIEVTVDEHPRNKIYLRPGEKLSVRNHAAKETSPGAVGPAAEEATSQKLLVSELKMDPEALTAPETSWKENQLVFDGERFDKVMSKISRWYNVEIEVTNEELHGQRFTADFENKTIRQVLDALQYTAGFKYKLVGDTVYIN
jgi:Fe2+-dicitrate sensor, membrane component